MSMYVDGNVYLLCGLLKGNVKHQSRYDLNTYIVFNDVLYENWKHKVPFNFKEWQDIRESIDLNSLVKQYYILIILSQVFRHWVHSGSCWKFLKV